MEPCREKGKEEGRRRESELRAREVCGEVVLFSEVKLGTGAMEEGVRVSSSQRLNVLGLLKPVRRGQTLHRIFLHLVQNKH